jgi:hypothetical protein
LKLNRTALKSLRTRSPRPAEIAIGVAAVVADVAVEVRVDASKQANRPYCRSHRDRRPEKLRKQN